VDIRGLTLRGAAESITQEQADGQLVRDSNNRFAAIPGAVAAGILVTERFDAKDITPHHVTVAGNNVSLFGGCGICSSSADHLRIENNVVTENGRWTIYASAGIAVEVSASTDDSTDTSIFIRNNEISNNESRVVNPYSSDDPAQQIITGGAGILLRDSRRSGADAAPGVTPYRGRFRIENNVISNNSGFGLAVRSTDRVDLVNNTFVDNAALDSEYVIAELEFAQADDVTLLNNLLATPADHLVARTDSATNITVGASLVNGTSQWGELTPPATLVTEAPQFFGRDSGDFRLRPESPAIDAGAADGAPADDHLGTPRPAGGGIDLGAYESG
jgi:parallel beta-helix repeat protein